MTSSAAQPPATASQLLHPRSRSRPLQPAAAPASASSNPPSNSRRHTLPFSFPPLFQSNTSSTSLAPSTAEGKPIPVDDSTAEHRTSALREFNSNFPSRHRYAKSTGAQSSTYSQPVIVRSYYPPSPSQPAANTDRGVIIVNGGGVGRGAGSDSGGPALDVGRLLPFASRITPAGRGMLSTMARARAKKQLHGPEDAKLPPIEAFSFKGFMENMNEQAGGNDLNADLDRIAEICAKSRYSLSNQYEVHYAPHGSGAAFLSTANRNQDTQGPTLQVVSSDDERSMKRHRKRRSAIRRNSRAMGTLETIMSSSRSSDEEKTKKKSAAEIAEEVRDRTTTTEAGDSSPTSSSRSGSNGHLIHEEQDLLRNARARRSGSLALIEGSRQALPPGETTTPRTSATGLVGEPALPLTSSSQLELRTAPEAPAKEGQAESTENKLPPQDGIEQTVVQGAISSTAQLDSPPSFLSALTGWVPWKAPDAFVKSKGRAEGSLRELLKNTDIKGKGVERVM